MTAATMSESEGCSTALDTFSSGPEVCAGSSDAPKTS